MTDTESRLFDGTEDLRKRHGVFPRINYRLLGDPRGEWRERLAGAPRVAEPVGVDSRQTSDWETVAEEVQQ